jgi:hypothetical protein
LTCGDFGGVNLKGEPCEALAGHGHFLPGEGRCQIHTPQKEASIKEAKRAFLQYLQPGSDVSMVEAAFLAGANPNLIHRWRKRDAVFAAAVEEAKVERGDFLRTRAEKLSGVMYRRGLSGEGSPAENIFLLKNWDREGYRDSHQVTGGGEGGAFVFQFVDPGQVDEDAWEAKWGAAERVEAEIESKPALPAPIVKS